MISNSIAITLDFIITDCYFDQIIYNMLLFYDKILFWLMKTKCIYVRNNDIIKWNNIHIIFI